MKKIGVLFLGIFLLGFLSNFILAIDGDNIQSNLEDKIDKLEKVKGDVETIKETNASYLAEEWKKIIKKNFIMNSIDEGFSFLSPFFQILIRESYSLSWRFFVILIMWIFVFWNLSKLFNSLFFQNLIGWGIGFITTFILGYLGFFQMFYSFLISLISQFTGWKKCLIITIFIFGIFILGALNKSFSQYSSEQKKKAEKDKEEFNRWMLNKIVSIYKKDIS